MREKLSVSVGIGKSVKRLINHPWFVGIGGGIIAGLFYFLLEKPHILVGIYRTVQDHRTILGVIAIVCTIIIGIALFIRRRYKVQIKKPHGGKEIPGKVPGGITIPSPSAELCLGRKTELINLEKDVTCKNVLLIKGVPGIGKTTLGLTFRDILEEKGYRTLWYQCDSESYEGFLIFLSDYLKNRGSITFQSLRDQSMPGKERLKNAVQELCTCKTVLFLDNFQKLNDSDFKVFKDHLKNSTLVLMSRTQPTFLLESYGGLSTLDKKASVDLLRELGVEESPGILEKIYRKTKGHPWSLVRFADLARVIPVRNLFDGLPGFGEKQEDYLNEECWRHLNEHEKDFLMRASVFTQPLIFEALEVCSKRGILTEIVLSLAQRFYFVKREEYYYIHDILKDFALLKLKENSELFNEAERAAAEYYGRKLSAENLLRMYYHLKEAGDYKEGLDSITKNISYFWREGYWLGVKKILEESLTLFTDEETRADIYFKLGTIVYKLSEWDKAIEYYEKSLEIKEKIGDTHGMAQTYNNLGLVYARKGEWDRAIEYYEKDLEIFEKIGDTHGMAQTYNNLGSVYADKGEWDRAIEYYEKDLEISEKIGDTHGIALTKNGIANILHDKKKFDDALKLYFESERTLKKIGDKFNLMKVYYNLFLCCKELNQKNKAQEYYQKYEELKQELEKNS